MLMAINTFFKTLIDLPLLLPLAILNRHTCKREGKLMFFNRRGFVLEPDEGITLTLGDVVFIKDVLIVAVAGVFG